MKKYIPVLVASGVLLLGFQNCQQSTGSGSGSSATSAQSKIEDPTLSQAQSLDILTQSDDKINLNLATGELIQNVQGTEIKKCLSESMRGQIQDLLASSSLCEHKEPAADVACAQVYAPAYGEIHWSNKSIKVGEAFSSCHKDVDLCGNDGAILRGLLRQVISRWNEWSCDFNVVSN